MVRLSLCRHICEVGYQWSFQSEQQREGQADPLETPFRHDLKNRHLLTGGGILFRVNEDGTVSMDELEKTVADISTNLNYLLDRQTKAEADANYLLTQTNTLQQQQAYTAQAQPNTTNNYDVIYHGCDLHTYLRLIV